jgi:hypothetical protein
VFEAQPLNRRPLVTHPTARTGLDRTDFPLALARLGKDSFGVDFDDLDRELARG